MAKKIAKGKQQGGNEQPPIKVSAPASPEPIPVRLTPRIETASRAQRSAQHRGVSRSGSQSERGWDNTQSVPDDGWGPGGHVEDMWADGGQEDGWDPDEHAPASGGLAAALASKLGRIADTRAEPAPAIKKKSTLKKPAPAAHHAQPASLASAPPVNKHVAFGIPPEPPTPPPASPGMHHSATGYSPSDWTAGESYSQVGGWEQSHSTTWGHAARQHAQARASPSPSSRNPPSPSEMYAQGAWTRWAAEANALGMPKVATTITASVPTTSPPVSQAYRPPANGSAGSKPPLLPQEQSTLLRSILSQPGQSKGTSQQVQPPSSTHRRQPSAPAAMGHSASSSPTPAAQPGQAWQSWGKTASSPTTAEHQRRHAEPKHHASQIQQADSWGSAAWGVGDGWGPSPIDDYPDDSWGKSHHGGRDSEWGVIPEEDEDGGEYPDDLDDMYTEPEEDGRRDHKSARYSPGVSYQYGAPPLPGERRHHAAPQVARSASLPSTPSSRGQGTPPLPRMNSSKTMNFAAGRMTTVFELPSPRNGMGEFTYIESQRDALKHAQRALYSKTRPVEDRIHWLFNSEKDLRVSSLIQWIDAMSNGLAQVGLQKFLETGQRGALISNADYRAHASPGAPSQPAFDWITLPELRPTRDKILQESVACYNPATHVIVFVFLLSRTGNSMAMWRKKLHVPGRLRAENIDIIAHVMGNSDEARPVIYVDQTSVPPTELEPSAEPPPKKKKRGFWKRLFRRK